MKFFSQSLILISYLKDEEALTAELIYAEATIRLRRSRADHRIVQTVLRVLEAAPRAEEEHGYLGDL